MIFNKSIIPDNLNEYNNLYKQSIDNPEIFWNDVAESFIWKNKWSKEEVTEVKAENNGLKNEVLSVAFA